MGSESDKTEKAGRGARRRKPIEFKELEVCEKADAKSMGSMIGGGRGSPGGGLKVRSERSRGRRVRGPLMYG